MFLKNCNNKKYDNNDKSRKCLLHWTDPRILLKCGFRPCGSPRTVIC